MSRQQANSAAAARWLELLTALDDHDWMRTEALSLSCVLPPSTVRGDLDRLQQAGLITASQRRDTGGRVRICWNLTTAGHTHLNEMRSGVS